MEDWQVAIGIMGIAIIIAIILSKRSWVHGKKKKRPKIDKLGDVESTDHGATFFAILLGLVATYFIVRFAMWVLPKIVKWITTPVRVNDTYSTINVTGWTNMESVSGQIGLPPNLIIFLVIALFILVFMAMFGGRWMRRNSLILFMMGIPILVVLGAPIKIILIIGIFIIPIIVWRGMRVLA